MDFAAVELPTGRALVMEIQEELIEHGYDPGGIDGQLGPKTVAAIKAYQKAQGLWQTGKPSQHLLEHLDTS